MQTRRWMALLIAPLVGCGSQNESHSPLVSHSSALATPQFVTRSYLLSCSDTMCDVLPGNDCSLIGTAPLISVPRIEPNGSIASLLPRPPQAICGDVEKWDQDRLRRQETGHCIRYQGDLDVTYTTCNSSPTPICNFTLLDNDDPIFATSAGSDPDACEQLPYGVQVCQQPPFAVAVTPSIPSGLEVCSAQFQQCDINCGDLDASEVVFNPSQVDYCASQCNPPGIEGEHWSHVYAAISPMDDHLTTVSGLVAGGPWHDKVCPNGLECTPGATCYFPHIADGDFGPHHHDRDFEYHIVPLANGAVDGSALSAVNAFQLNGGGLPTVGVEVEYMHFYPRQGADLSTRPAQGSYEWPLWYDGYMLNTPHFSLNVKNGVNQQPQAGASFWSPVLSAIGDGWHVDMPMVGDQIVTRGVLIWDCGHQEWDGLGMGYHTEIHPPVAAAWLHRPLEGDPAARPHSSVLFIKALSHAPYPSGTYHPFDGLSATLTIPHYDPELPVYVSAPIVDYNTGLQNGYPPGHSAFTWSQYGYVLNLASYPSQDVFGYFSGAPDIIVSGAGGTMLPKYWNIGVTYLGSGQLALQVTAAFPGGSDYNVTEATITPDFPLTMGAHVEICQPVYDAGGNITNGCGICSDHICAASSCGTLSDPCGGMLACGACAGGSCASNVCSYKLMVGVVGPGTITGSGISCTSQGGSCSTIETAGSSVTLAAVPATGYSVTSWSGCAPSPDLSTCTLSMSGNATIGVTFKDITPPTVTVPIAPTVTATSANGAMVSYMATAYDTVSGSLTPTCTTPSGSLFPPGTTVVTCSATDEAGNTASASFQVLVTFSSSGYLQPISADSSTVFKLGRTIPVKFQLTGASAGITDLSAHIFVAPYSNGAVGAVEAATATAAANSGNTFRYDPITGQYIFNLATSSLSQGAWALRSDLGDGVLHDALILLR